MITSEQIKEICRLQHIITLCNILIGKMPLGYTQDDINELKRDLDIRAKKEAAEKELEEIIKILGADAIGTTFSDPEIMKKPENRFTFDDQRKATFDVIGKELTLEEVFDKYLNNE